MYRPETQETLTRVKRRNTFRAYGQTQESGEETSRYTMFIIGATSFFAGFWAISCLISAIFQAGPLSVVKQLAVAITGQ
jgi:hypothetical protein